MSSQLAGHLLLEGKSVEFRKCGGAENAGIVLVHQEILLASDLTVAENLYLGSRGRPRSPGQ